MLRIARFLYIATLFGGLTACATDPSDPADPDDPPVDPQPDPQPDPEPEQKPGNAVYILSNEADANRVVVFERAADGTLRAGDAYVTGGRGSGGGLGSQGALIFDGDGQQFFAVNAGDNTLSMLGLEGDGSLTRASTVSSGGVHPVSVTMHGDLVYVVNAGDDETAANISGFRITASGLEPIAGSSQPLSAAQPVPAQISFSPDGSMLVVTEKATNQIVTYALTNGIAGQPDVQPSAGQTPFGFAWSPAGHLLVAEAFGGAAGLGAATSYAMGTDGMLTSISPSVGNGQGAPCWTVYANGHVYTTNTGSDTITAYTLGSDGSLTLSQQDGVAALTAGGPADADVSDDNKFLYTLDAREDRIGSYAIAADGSLTRLPDLAGVAANGVGLVAR